MRAPRLPAFFDSQPMSLRVISLALCLMGTAAAGERTVDYDKEIKPLLASRCSACHGALRQRGKLRLDHGSFIRQGGRNGPAAEPGEGEASLILEAASGTGALPAMPPAGEGTRLDRTQLDLLRTWIDQGASSPPDEPVPTDPREHWAYKKPIATPPPAVREADSSRNPVDAYLAADRERLGLVESPPADKPTLLRRVFLDLIGLPPTRDELIAFLSDSSSDAYERVVDRLLSDPRHGERWARHWMDVWRYSDWYGRRYLNNHRFSQRHVWRWRDWIVDSLNADKGYDRMIVEMLAGDEVAPSDPDVVRATGYLGRSWFRFNKTTWLQDTVEHLGAGLLATTFKCARCHDHKYDPIAQEDYYRLRAVFEPHEFRVDRVPGRRATINDPEGGGVMKPGPVLADGLSRVFDASPSAPTYRFIKGQESQPAKDKPLTPGVPSALRGDPFVIRPVKLPRDAFYPELREFVEEEAKAESLKSFETALAEVESSVAGESKARSAFETALFSKPWIAQNGPTETDRRYLETISAGLAVRKARLAVERIKAEILALDARYRAERAKYSDPPRAEFAILAKFAASAEHSARVASAEESVVAQEKLAIDAKAAVKSGDAKSVKAVADAEATLVQTKKQRDAAISDLSKSSSEFTPIGIASPSESTGRRLALARWIADRENPLTARVAVNHVWLRHFGQALVPTVTDFGLKGERPLNQPLLDALAVEFMEKGWSMKTLHRLIVTSRAYRMRAELSDSVEVARNRRIDPDNKRLWRMNRRPLEAEVVRDSVLYVSGGLDPKQGGQEIDPAEIQTSPRRSLYFLVAPDVSTMFLSQFDPPSPEECYRRQESVAPSQSLALINSDLALRRSRALADRLSSASPDDETFTVALFEQVLTRAPGRDELRECLAYLREGSPETGSKARENLAHVLINHNDFVTRP